MRTTSGRLVLALALGVLVLSPRPGIAWTDTQEPTDQDIIREQLEALEERERAETDEEVDRAERRFDDAARLQLERSRDRIDTLLEQP